MSWSETYRDEKGQIVTVWLGDQVISFADVLKYVDSLRPNTPLAEVFLGYHSRVLVSRPPSEIEAEEKAELSRLRKKYPNV